MTNPPPAPQAAALHPVRESDGLSGISRLPVPANAIRHSCGEWWTGIGAAHCGGTLATTTLALSPARDGDTFVAAGFDAEPHERPIDGGRAAIKPLADLVSAEPDSVKVRRFVPPRNRFERVFDRVGVGTESFKIGISVVGFDVVDVVNVLCIGDPAVEDAVFVGLDALLGSNAPSESDVSVGTRIPTRFVRRDLLARGECSDNSRAATLPTLGATALLGGAGDSDTTVDAGFGNDSHELIVQVKSLCHRTFTSVSAFTAHRRKSECVNPETLGMVPADRKWRGWSLPGTWTPEDAA